MKKEIKYIFEVAHPKEDFKIRNKANTFEGLKKKSNINLLLPNGYFENESGYYNECTLTGKIMG